MPVSGSIFCPLTFEPLGDVVGRAGRGKTLNAPEILVRLLPRLLNNDTTRRVGISKRRRRLGLALKDFKNELAVERKAQAIFGVVLAEDFLGCCWM